MKTTTISVLISLIMVAQLLCCCCCLPASGANNITSSSTTNSKCTFVIVVKTGSMEAAGTDARVSVRFEDPAGGPGVLYIPDLKIWPHKSADPFERGSEDTFYVRINGATTTCMMYPCKMRLQSDGTGPNPGWYVESVFLLVVAESPMDEFSHMFKVNQWLAVDEPPYQLFAERDDCAATGTGAGADPVGAAVM